LFTVYYGGRWQLYPRPYQNFLVANTTFTTAVREYEDVSLPATYR